MIELSVANHIAEVCINRPDKKNAFSFELLEALSETAAQIKQMPEVRTVVIYGAQGVFSAGIDLGLLQSVAGQLDEIKGQMRNPPEGQLGNLFQQPITVWQEVQVPVIAALEGVCYGAGMQLALAADFRIAARDARLSIMEAKWGLIPDMGLTQSLPRLMRADHAKELMMTGRVLDAVEAQEKGLVTHVSDNALEDARTMAAGLAARSPQAVQASKQLVEGAWAKDPTALALEAELQAQIIGTHNQIETMISVMQKRAPNYR